MQSRIIMRLCLLYMILLCLATSASGESYDIQESILKIYSFKSDPSYYSPWRLHEPEQQIGSGCVISGKRILTNAHLVANANYIQFKFNRDPMKYDARVQYVSHDVDLAILEPMDPSILDDVPALDIGELPNMLDEVLVFGFPVGGDVLSITKGVLSRAEYQMYSHSLLSLLAGQLDAAINPGNSGGPVIVGGRIVGIVMQKTSSDRVENIGYMIPAPIIRHFLADIEDGVVDSIPALGYSFQDMESPSLKGMYKMEPEHTGVLVKDINWDSPAAGQLKSGDIILEIDGYNVADDGTIEFRRDERIAFFYSYEKHQVGDTVQIKVLRDGKEKDISVRLDKYTEEYGLISRLEYDKEPTFFIYGGMVFLPVNYNYFCTWKDCDAPDRFTMLTRKSPEKRKREYAAMLRVLPATINKGYHGLYNFIIEKVNGKDYVDFADFYDKVVNSDSKYVVLSDDMNYQIVIDREMAIKSHDDILEQYKISKDKSEDLKVGTK